MVKSDGGDQRELGDQGAAEAMAPTSPFDAIRRADANGNEYWSARELAGALGYTEWRNFKRAIQQARIACEASGYAVSDHFVDVNKLIATGKGARRRIEDVKLSRYACYLIVQNADPEKPIVALGQTYFAEQTRRQELAGVERLSEPQKRLALREQMRASNTELAATARDAGVITAQDFATFQDHGYMGLYNGERARDIHARKGLKRGQHILDHMGSTELAANWFRATQAEDKIRREGIRGKAASNQAHYDMGSAVRRFIVDEQDGTPPEQLPTPAQSIQQVARAEQARIEREAQRERQPLLFDEDMGDGSDS